MQTWQKCTTPDWQMPGGGECVTKPGVRLGRGARRRLSHGACQDQLIFEKG